MTLISIISPNDFPVLLGDLLISAPASNDGRRVSLPSFISETRSEELTNGSFSIVGLSQKVAVINDYLAVAWSGSKIAAKGVLTDLKENVPPTPMTSDDFFKYLDSLNYKETTELSLIGLAIDAEGKIHRFAQNHKLVKYDPLNKIYVAGSGADDFVSHLLESFPEDFKTSGEMNAYSKAISSVLIYGGLLFFNEMNSRSNLEYYYGGGFEFVTPIRDADTDTVGLKKIPEITTLFWIDDQRSGNITMAPVVFKQRYIGDVLVITRCFLTREHDNKSKPITNYLITPVYEDIDISEFANIFLPNFNSLILIHYILRITESGEQTVGCMLNWNNALVKFKGDDLNLEIEVPRGFVDEYLSLRSEQ
jgi:hypothetical protein